MKILINEKLSEHKYKTPEGYLICVDSVLARTGKQTYRRNEVFGDSDDDSEIEVDRPAKEVFSDATLASFENKPITVEHPDEDVNAENYKDYAVGFVRDVHKGMDNGMDVIVGTLVITDAKTIEEIENGEHTDLSCGYDCDITDEENPQQRNIRGNHVALCAQGRAGNARIVDTAVKEEETMQDAKTLKEYTEGFAVMPMHEWKKKLNGKVERYEKTYEEAYRQFNHLMKGDPYTDFVIINCKTKERQVGTPQVDARDAMTKPEAITIIKKMIVNPKYAHESYDGITYLTPEATSKIAQIAKEAGLTRRDLESIDSFMFGRAGYHIVDDEDIEDEKPLYGVLVNEGSSSTHYYAYANTAPDAVGKVLRKVEKQAMERARKNIKISKVYVVEKEPERRLAWQKGIITDEFEEETGPDMEDTDFNDTLHTYEIKWMDLVAKSKGWADYKHNDKIKAGTLREALEKLGNTVGFGVGTANMLIINVHRDDGRTYQYTDKLSNLLKKSDLADDAVEDALVAPDEKILKEFERRLATYKFGIESKRNNHLKGIHYQVFVKGHGFNKNDLKFYAVQLNNVSAWAERNGYPMSYNIGLSDDGRITAGVDIYGKSVKDSVKDSKVKDGAFTSRLISDLKRMYPNAKMEVKSRGNYSDIFLTSDKPLSKQPLISHLKKNKFLIEGVNYIGATRWEDDTEVEVAFEKNKITVTVIE